MKRDAHLGSGMINLILYILDNIRQNAKNVFDSFPLENSSPFSFLAILSAH